MTYFNTGFQNSAEVWGNQLLYLIQWKQSVFIDRQSLDLVVIQENGRSHQMLKNKTHLCSGNKWKSTRQRGEHVSCQSCVQEDIKAFSCNHVLESILYEPEKSFLTWNMTLWECLWASRKDAFMPHQGTWILTHICGCWSCMGFF